MKLTARPGFTLPELLIAGAIGTAIVGLGIQHTYEFFRIQGRLVAKTELRHVTQQVQDRIGQVLRQAAYVLPVGSDYLLILPQDRDRCGYICPDDKYELLWWQIQPDPAKPENSYLLEKSLITPAFKLPDDATKLLKLYQKLPGGTARRVATSVQALEIKVEAPGLYSTHVTVARSVPHQKEPTVLSFTELIAARSKPREKYTVPFETMFAVLLATKGGGGR